MAIIELYLADQNLGIIGLSLFSSNMNMIHYLRWFWWIFWNFCAFGYKSTDEQISINLGSFISMDLPLWCYFRLFLASDSIL